MFCLNPENLVFWCEALRHNPITQAHFTCQEIKRCKWMKKKKEGAQTEFCREVSLLITTSCVFSFSDCKMPAVIERAVRKQNVHFLHNRIQYSVEFFQFMRKLVTANAAQENSVRGQKLTLSAYFSLQLLVLSYTRF